jgi:protein AroM
MVRALGRFGQRIGVMVPGAAQVRHYHDAASGKMIAAHASPYGRPRWREAVAELSDADVIVMHCMGYDRAMREQVAALSGKPTLLSRSLVASAVAELL